MQIRHAASSLAMLFLLANACTVHAVTPELDVDQRANRLVAQMTQDEKLKLVLVFFGAEIDGKGVKKHPDALAYSAGFVEGIPRLGIPALLETDGGIGVATQSSGQLHARERTALPSGLATAATWNTRVAFQNGAMIGAEARASGFNVMLAGAVNLVREPRNGRNFEYAGEDPWLAAAVVAEQIKGVESNHLIATMKHFALNAQETGRFVLDAQIAETGARMSDLLAMQLVIEQANPGAVMCAYNRFNGVYACENNFLLNTVLKKDWGYAGFVMSDWGATHSAADAANNGLDQESGWEFDTEAFFSGALRSALQRGLVSQARLNDMVHRIVRTMTLKGVIDAPATQDHAAEKEIDYAADALVSRHAAEESLVLLKNRRQILPLQSTLHKIIVIGAHADVGVLSGGGSSQVYPIGGMAVPGLTPSDWPGPVVYFPSAPLHFIQLQASAADVIYYDGSDPILAGRLAAEAEVAIVFADQWIGEANDARSLTLPGSQDALIGAVATANSNTIVVLETGGPVTMPWLGKVAAVLEAWYPGSSGGEAIARVLFGAVNPSGHLPLTFARSEAQLVRPVLDGDREHEDRPFAVNYREGAAVGYKWFDLTRQTPLFPFGFGLSYTEFVHSDLKVACAEVHCAVSFTVANAGRVAGKDVAQVYVHAIDMGWEAPTRLAAFDKVDLEVGKKTSIIRQLDPRLLAVFEPGDGLWHVRGGHYQVRLARYANDPRALTKDFYLPAKKLTMQGQVRP